MKSYSLSLWILPFIIFAFYLPKMAGAERDGSIKHESFRTYIYIPFHVVTIRGLLSIKRNGQSVCVCVCVETRKCRFHPPNFPFPLNPQGEHWTYLLSLIFENVCLKMTIHSVSISLSISLSTSIKCVYLYLYVYKAIHFTTAQCNGGKTNASNLPVICAQ